MTLELLCCRLIFRYKKNICFFYFKFDFEEIKHVVYLDHEKYGVQSLTESLPSSAYAADDKKRKRMSVVTFQRLL